MFETNAHAVAALYLAYFNRPAEPDGLVYWTARLDAGASFFDIARDFATTGEARALYPFLAGDGPATSFVQTVFSSIYSRWPSTLDADYWHGEIEDGKPGWQVLAELILAARGGDIEWIRSKLDASLHISERYAELGTPYAVDDARWLLTRAANTDGMENTAALIDDHFAPPAPDPEPKARSKPAYDFSGDDTYHVHAPGIVIDEKPGGGTDTVMASISYALPANVERLVLTGVADLNGQGNDADNEIIGNAGHNILSGFGGDDTLVGNAGNDVLDGGAGADRMEGGEGDDIYYVDDVGDVVIELAGEGTDTVYVSLNAYSVPDHVEIVIFNGTGEFIGRANDRGSEIRGGAWDNTLYGGDGDDRLVGGNGNDTLDGGAGDDELYGSNGVNVLIGGPGADLLSLGGTSNTLVYSKDDIVQGGAGDRITGYISGLDRFEIEVPGLETEPLTYFVDDLALNAFEGSASGSASPQLILSHWNGTIWDSNNYLWVDFDGSDTEAGYLIANLGTVSVVTAGDIWIT